MDYRAGAGCIVEAVLHTNIKFTNDNDNNNDNNDTMCNNNTQCLKRKQKN